MKRVFNRFIFLLFILIFTACKELSLEKKIQALYHAEIVIPPSLLSQCHRTHLEQARVTMIVYYDSVGCASCAIGRIAEWNYIRNYYTDSLDGRVASLFIFAPARRHLRKVQIALRDSDADYPIVVDSTGAFLRANPAIPSDRRCHAFLLNRENRVVAIGSPLYNDAVWDLYKRLLPELLRSENKPIQTIER